MSSACILKELLLIRADMLFIVEATCVAFLGITSRFCQFPIL
jgi:hypothetical protein